MSDKVFADSNIIIYAFSQDLAKRAVAERILSNSEVSISSQVVGEVCVNLRKKAGFDANELGAVVKELYNQFNVLEIKQTDFLVSASLLDRYSLSYWDSLIVAVALKAESSVLYSEDMQDGLIIGSMVIKNPFAG